MVALLVLTAALALAIISARSYAGSWNDASSLATVESLVDHGTLAIDRSIFVQAPARGNSTAPSPFPKDEPQLLQYGTLDKLFINGHFYSDKPPVPALLMAGFYQLLQWCSGLQARARPDLFCFWMTVGSSGLAYVLAVWCTFRLGRPLRLPISLRLALTSSFGLSTLALTYARHVNRHILLLGVAAALLLNVSWLAVEVRQHRIWRLLLALGTLAGLGYTMDLGVGPVLFLSTLALVVHRRRSLRHVALFVGAATPWVALHYALNYAVAGTLRPANTIPEYFQWPGSPFNSQNMTGAWNHPTVGHFLTYAVALLVGKHGFFGHNLPLFAAALGAVVLLARSIPERPEILHACCWSAGSWLLYALTSTNYSGVAASIRWFVPLLAAGYYVLSVFLREYPHHRRSLIILSGWGAVIAGVAWWSGPWMKRMIPFFWPLQAAALLNWFWAMAKWRRQEAGKVRHRRGW